MLKKLDNLFLKFTDRVVMFFVIKSKYKKHKYDINFSLTKIKIIFFIIMVYILPSIGYFIDDKISNYVILIHFFVWSIVFIMILINYKSNYLLARSYDLIFNLRKHPVAYNEMKKMTEAMYKKNEGIRKDMNLIVLVLIFVIVYLFGILIISTGFGLYLSYIIFLLIDLVIFGTIDRYVFYVFDFDEPDKQKKAKRELTKVVQEAFDNLVRGMKPSALPI